MITIFLTAVVLIFSAIGLYLLVLVLRRLPSSTDASSEQILREELRISREESSREARSLREEVAKSQKEASESVVNVLSKLGEQQGLRLSEVVAATTRLEESYRKELGVLREKIEASSAKSRKIMSANWNKCVRPWMKNCMTHWRNVWANRLNLSASVWKPCSAGWAKCSNWLRASAISNAILTNVKERGTWGGVPVGRHPRAGSHPRSVRSQVSPQGRSGTGRICRGNCPGHGMPTDNPSGCPSTPSFPKEDYERLVDAAQQGDAEGVRKSTAALIATIEKCARDIRDKYLNPPRTTDFAILFMPTEGLYAEVLRQPGFHDRMQQNTTCC